MKKVLVVLAVLVFLAGVAVFAALAYFRSGAAFGIDDAHPLGRLQETEAHLVRFGLVKDEAALNSLSRAFLGRQVLYYEEAREEGEADRITVVADTAGRIEEVKAVVLRRPGETLPSKVRTLCGLYWNAAGGVLPEFGEKAPEEELSHRFTRRRVTGKWTRSRDRDTVALEVR